MLSSVRWFGTCIEHRTNSELRARANWSDALNSEGALSAVQMFWAVRRQKTHVELRSMVWNGAWSRRYIHDELRVCTYWGDALNSDGMLSWCLGRRQMLSSVHGFEIWDGALSRGNILSLVHA